MTPKERADKLLRHNDNPDMAQYEEMADIADALKTVADTFSKMNIESVKGEQGEPGYTPQRGKDYFTKEDIKEVAEEAHKLVRVPKDGQDGQDGKDGQDGQDGKDGYTPVKGLDYFDGLDGVNGRDGKDGRNGSPDSPQEIVEKLSSLKGRSRLDASAIKNLPQAVSLFGNASGLKGLTEGTNISVDNSNSSYPSISSGIRIQVDGVDISTMVHTLNFTGGSVVTVSNGIATIIGGGPAGPSGTGLTTETGDYLMTEAGEYLII